MFQREVIKDFKVEMFYVIFLGEGVCGWFAYPIPLATSE
jgi:hypothetical protein